MGDCAVHRMALSYILTTCIKYSVWVFGLLVVEQMSDGRKRCPIVLRFQMELVVLNAFATPVLNRFKTI